MAADIKFYATNDQDGQDSLTQHLAFNISGELADSTAYTFQFLAPAALQIVDIQTSLLVTGAGGTDVETSVKNAGTEVQSTLGGIAVAAAAAANTKVGGVAATGVTHPVLKTDGTEDVAASAIILITVTADGTFSTQPKDFTCMLSYKEHQDFNPVP